MQKLFAAFIVLAFVGAANAQDLMARLNLLEQNNNAIISRLSAVESKIDALSAKLDRISSVGSAVVPSIATVTAPLAFATVPTTCAPGSACSQAPTTVFTSTEGIVYTSYGSAGACGAAGSSAACGSASANGFGSGSWTPVRNVVRRVFGGRKGAGGCGS